MPPRDDDKAMDGLLRRSLARDAAAGTCPEPDILAAYTERSLEADEMARYELHFSECARCREQLAAIFRAGSVAEIPVMQETSKAVEAVPRAVAVSPATTDSPERRARFRILDWRWLAPVAAAILVVVFIYGHNASRFGKPLNSTAEVAISKPEPLPPAGLVDNQLNAQHPAAPPPAPTEPRAKSAGRTQQAAPPLSSKLPLMARNYPAAAPTPDKEVARLDALRAEEETRNDLKKRAEAAISNNLEKPAPSEVGTYSAAKRGADLAPTASAPSAAPAPGATASTQIETKAGTRAGAPAQKSLAGGMVNARKQSQGAAGSNAAAKVSTTSEMVEVQSSALVIQTPDAGVQYRVPAVGFVERSEDGGTTWQSQRVKMNAEILAGAAPSENVCWLVGRGGVVLMTSDGKNWIRVSSAAKVDLVAVTASDATFATVTAADGRKYSTQNGGMTWQLLK